AERYPSAGELAADVQRFLADEPVTAYREPLGRRLARWGRRHRPVVAGAVALLLTAGVSLSVGTVLLAPERARAPEVGAVWEVTFRGARSAVEDALAETAGRDLADTPQMEQVRRRLLEKALGFYTEFLQERRDDPVVRQETARAYARVGEIRRLLGQQD